MDPNDMSTEEAKYCDVFESLNENESVKEFVVTHLTEKNERTRTVERILNLMGERYLRSVGEKVSSGMKDMYHFKIYGSVENMLDRFEKLMIEVKKLDLAQTLNYAMTLPFIERMEKNGKINSDEKY